MSRLKLSIATTDYDHFRDFRLGTVQAEGIETTWSMLGHHEIFARFTFNREWDAAELSFAKFMRAGHAQELRHHRPAGDLLAAVPVLVVLRQQEEQDQDARRTSRARRSARRNGRTPPRSTCAAGSTTSTAWRLKDIHWVQAGANEAGRIEKVELSLPKGVKLTRVAGQVAERDAGVGRDRLRHHRAAAGLLPARATRTWCGCSRISGRWRRRTSQGTKVWPIMHIIALQKARARRQPLGRAQSLQRLPRLQEPQRRAADRPRGVALSGGLAADLRCARWRDLFGGDPFPYGIDENRPTWEQMLRYTHEQGIAHRHAKPEEIFPKGIMTVGAGVTRYGVSARP